ncbi:hypothetical protein MIV114L [Invertebrate iridescent virus 3]|uniref:Uncharacterized protein 114L n=1 Tax=Invertebrate iridescent virus 3 TaxID=345201 RepID=114L_IIV3|nr:hypothetical protein MIV114L [Invertebrate iridescent virus 3]Q196U6.1 RecName: Full=Uncharacterized protein 114L; Flags: Precursor [Invertebrate iridescent virus 3]ABF82144.1 hypothetical protein MIV114L [Invertebrate iridescent virus 3]
MKTCTVICCTALVLGLTAYAQKECVAVSSQLAQIIGHLPNKSPLSAFTRRDLIRAFKMAQESGHHLAGEKPRTFTEKMNHQMVLTYLKRYNYLAGGHITPETVKRAVLKLQHNSGVLEQTGVIDVPTINFVKTHPRGHVEPLPSQ